MNFFVKYKIFISYLQSGYAKNNKHHLLTIVFLYYASLRFKKFINNKITFKCLNDKAIDYFINKYFHDNYVDAKSCVFGNLNNVNIKKWINICSVGSGKKYKIQFININCLENNIIYLSDVTFYNIKRLFNHNDESLFFIREYIFFIKHQND